MSSEKRENIAQVDGQPAWRPDGQRNSLIKEQKNSFVVVVVVKGGLNILEKAMDGLEQRLNEKAKGLVSQVVLRAANRHLVLYDLDQLTKVNGRQRCQNR